MRTLYLLLWGAGVTVVLTAPSKGQPPCGTFTCDSVYDPVCGVTDCGRCKTFSNECYLALYNCEHSRKYKLCAEGDCVKKCCKCNCKKICGQGRRECGTNCEFCKDTCDNGGESCDFSCTAHYDPVCGINKQGEFKTFSNACVMRLENCLLPDKDKYEFVGNGECA